MLNNLITMRINLFILLIITTQLLFAQTDSLKNNPADTTKYYNGLIVQIQAAPIFTNNLYTRTNLDDYSNSINPSSLNKEHISYLIGANIGYISKDWLIITGLHFTNHSSDFHLKEEKEIISNNDTNTTIIKINYTNRSQNLSIPLSFGYITNINKWSLAIKAGIYFDICLTYDGYTYDFKEKELINLEDNFSTFLISYSIDAALKYQFNNKIGLFLNPFYISGINSMWKNSPVYAWKQIHYGLSIGIEYRINNTFVSLSNE